VRHSGRFDPRLSAEVVRLGRQTLGELSAAARREWLVADGLGGYAMGTAAGLRTRRYHGLLVVATRATGGSRRVGLAALDPTLVIGERRVRLAVHEWPGEVIDPAGHLHLESFALDDDGLPTWRWSLGDVVLERRLAMVRGRPALAVTHRLVRAPGAVRLELAVLCTWRDAHGERLAGEPPHVEQTVDGLTFERAYRVAGPGFRPAGGWYRGARYRVEAERGLPDREDLWHAGDFAADLEPGGLHEVVAWAGELDRPPPPAAQAVTDASIRGHRVAARGGVVDEPDRMLLLAADQHVVAGPAVVAGYPWFGEWCRDTMTSYEGLLLETGREDEGRALLLRAAETLSEGMLANTADAGEAEYDSVDGTLWFLHAVGRHVQRTGDHDLAHRLLPVLTGIVDQHLQGTRFGIRVDRDGLVTQGAEGRALTWMDARVGGRPVTPRAGKAVEVNALWINDLALLVWMADRLGRDSSRYRSLRDQAGISFRRRFLRGGRCLDVVDAPEGDDATLRPNQLLAVSLPLGPLVERGVVDSCGPLLTSLGLRTLPPDAPGYRGRHRGSSAERDAAYHQGTVWPWLIGPYVEASRRCGLPLDGLLDGLEAHLGEWGLGSVSETADGEAPHDATGCPFQAWSVAELLRARRLAMA
jgi:predicted glycogen debranching enzyme